MKEGGKEGGKEKGPCVAAALVIVGSRRERLRAGGRKLEREGRGKISTQVLSRRSRTGEEEPGEEEGGKEARKEEGTEGRKQGGREGGGGGGVPRERCRCWALQGRR
jgi:hypothetical protein